MKEEILQEILAEAKEIKKMLQIIGSSQEQKTINIVSDIVNVSKKEEKS